MYERMSDYAIYLGEGIWWQLTERDRCRGRFSGLPAQYRPWRPA